MAPKAYDYMQTITFREAPTLDALKVRANQICTRQNYTLVDVEKDAGDGVWRLYLDQGNGKEAKLS